MLNYTIAMPKNASLMFYNCIYLVILYKCLFYCCQCSGSVTFWDGSRSGFLLYFVPIHVGIHFVLCLLARNPIGLGYTMYVRHKYINAPMHTRTLKGLRHEMNIFLTIFIQLFLYTYVLVVFDNLLSESKSKFLLKRKSFSDFDPQKR